MKSTVIKNFIAGQFPPAEAQFEDSNPVDGTIMAMVAEADRKMVDNTIHAARAAPDGDWDLFSAEDRARLLHALADEIEKRFGGNAIRFPCLQESRAKIA